MSDGSHASSGARASNGPGHYQVLIVGGGTAGVSVAARLCRKLDRGAVAIVEPSTVHYYQPLWTLVGGGVCEKQVTERSEASVIPDRAEWVRDTVATFDPKRNEVGLSSGRRLSYGYLVVCPGIQLDWNHIEELEGNVGRHGICSNYSYDTVQDTWPTIQGFQSGRALFTHPKTPVKCGGAPMKVMFLAESAFRRRGIRQQADVRYLTGEAASFTSPHYAKALDQIRERRGMTTHLLRELVAVRPEQRIAVFECLDRPGEREELEYGMLHVTPPMSAPDFVKQSPLSNPAGWVDVDKDTLQHQEFANVFGLGDASSLPTSKTGAAIRKQVPVVVENVLASIQGKAPHQKYDGYTACPVVTDYGKVVLAEFNYDKEPSETFPFDQARERLSMYLMKRYALPLFYWQGMLKGRA